MAAIAQRVGRPVLPIGDAAGAVRAYPGYLRDWRDYRRLHPYQSVRVRDAYPCLADRTDETPFDAHYVYQSVWATESIIRSGAEEHVDVGSDIRFTTLLAPHVPVTAVDIRPLKVSIANFRSIAGSVTDLPFEDRSIVSLSCLHVAEHIGLGRYGDPLDALGTQRACAELARVLAPQGQLLFSIPVGRPRTMFNAHRIHRAVEVLDFFPDLTLTAFSFVRDDGVFVADAPLESGFDCVYGCGLYGFTRAGSDDWSPRGELAL
jgi:SAM-dependent methyltransferase